MQGRLYVIDGLDGSGKSTQAQRVYEAMCSRGERVRLISFPDYKDESSALVRMYLGGEFPGGVDGVNAYAASSFYAVDRYASYMRHWKQAYEAGWTILATRYVSSNAIHQMGKLPSQEWPGFLDWLSDFEYTKLGLPRPDRIVFLDMPRAVADALIEHRYQGDERKKDIHERDRAYLLQCGKTAAYAARAEGWTVISCAVPNGEGGWTPRPENEISEEILHALNLDYTELK